MGFSVELFVNKIDPNLICNICHEVFEKPVTLECGCVFCKECIEKWLKNSRYTCPNDRSEISKSKRENLGNESKILSNVISQLEVRCPLRMCEEVFKLEEYEAHQQKCKFNVANDGFNPFLENSATTSQPKAFVNSRWDMEGFFGLKITNIKNEMQEKLKDLEEKLNLKLSKADNAIATFEKCTDTLSEKVELLGYDHLRTRKEAMTEIDEQKKQLTNLENRLTSKTLAIQAEMSEFGKRYQEQHHANYIFVELRSEIKELKERLTRIEPCCNQCCVCYDWNHIEPLPVMEAVVEKLIQNHVPISELVAEVVKRVDFRVDYKTQFNKEKLMTKLYLDIRRAVTCVNSVAKYVQHGSKVLIASHCAKFFILCMATLVGSRGVVCQQNDPNIFRKEFERMPHLRNVIKQYDGKLDSLPVNKYDFIWNYNFIERKGSEFDENVIKRLKFGGVIFMGLVEGDEQIPNATFLVKSYHNKLEKLL